MRTSSRYRPTHFKNLLPTVHKCHRRVIQLDTSSTGSTLTQYYKIFSVQDACSTHKHENPKTPCDILTSSASFHCIWPTGRPERDQIHCTSSNCAGVRCFHVSAAYKLQSQTPAHLKRRPPNTHADGRGPIDSTPKLLPKLLITRR